MYDTSVKVPAIMAHPGRIKQGEVATELVSSCDFMPTLLEYIGLEQEIPRGLPGESFMHILEGSEGTERESVVIYNEYGPVRMIRTKEWKYVHRYPFGPHELYDLITDPGERFNLVDKTDLQDVVAKLKLDMEEWFVRFVDPETDGLREAVTGKGQIDKIGLKGAGKRAFYDFYVHNVPTPFSIWVSHKGGE
jgi:arylsulfatase A-like enzyme